jgi:hypothetical protein
MKLRYVSLHFKTCEKYSVVKRRIYPVKLIGTSCGAVNSLQVIENVI